MPPLHGRGRHAQVDATAAPAPGSRSRRQAVTGSLGAVLGNEQDRKALAARREAQVAEHVERLQRLLPFQAPGGPPPPAWLVDDQWAAKAIVLANKNEVVAALVAACRPLPSDSDDSSGSSGSSEEEGEDDRLDRDMQLTQVNPTAPHSPPALAHPHGHACTPTHSPPPRTECRGQRR